MQVVSGYVGREKVHFEAPSAERLEREMAAFLEWFNAPLELDPVLKAGIAHLWFVTTHPFEDGNGRIARVIDGAEETLAAVLRKARVWNHANQFPLNERQCLVLTRLLDNFSGKRTSSKYAKLAKISQDTAIRDIKELVAHGILKQSEGGGRSTAYEIVVL